MKKTTKLIILGLMAVTSGAYAQDKLASMAPIDRKLRAIDSVSIVKLLQKEEIYQMPASALYPTWNNEYVRSYGVELPQQYRID
ncbi:MAG: peptidase M23, partial [Paraprevotella sp.]|nr:peptidase M23 [Paraprevotella sp.]